MNVILILIRLIHTNILINVTHYGTSNFDRANDHLTVNRKHLKKLRNDANRRKDSHNSYHI